MTVVGPILRRARLDAGLTQAELAERMGTTQSAVARLEANDSNPSIETLDRALRAADHKLRIEVYQGPQEVDETLIAAQLQMSPADRLRTMEASARNARELRARVGRVD